jgi:hypothetical protein
MIEATAFRRRLVAFIGQRPEVRTTNPASFALCEQGRPTVVFGAVRIVLSTSQASRSLSVMAGFR